MYRALTVFVMGTLSACRTLPEPCDEAPFRADAVEWSAAQPDLKAVADYLAETNALNPSRKSDWYMEKVVEPGLKKACHAKYSTTDLRDQDFIADGINGDQQKSLPVTTIALRFFHSEGFPQNPDTNVLCTLNGPNGDALWGTAADCAQFHAQRGATARTRQIQHDQTIQAQRDLEQQQHPGITYTYALFLCNRQTSECELQGAPRIALGDLMPGMFFHSLAECEERAGQIAPTHRDGHFFVNESTWFECRRRAELPDWESIRK